MDLRDRQGYEFDVRRDMRVVEETIDSEGQSLLITDQIVNRVGPSCLFRYSIQFESLVKLDSAHVHMFCDRLSRNKLN